MRSCQASSKKASRVRESPLQNTPYELGAAAGLETPRAQGEGAAALAMDPVLPLAHCLVPGVTAGPADIRSTAGTGRGGDTMPAAELTPPSPAAAAFSGAGLGPCSRWRSAPSCLLLRTVFSL